MFCSACSPGTGGNSLVEKRRAFRSFPGSLAGTHNQRSDIRKLHISHDDSECVYIALQTRDFVFVLARLPSRQMQYMKSDTFDNDDVYVKALVCSVFLEGCFGHKAP